MTPPGRGRSGALKIVLPIVAVVLLLCCVGGVVLAVNLFGDDVGDAKAGDCLKGKSIDQNSDQFQEAQLEKVECSESGAKYKVVGRVEDKTQAEAQRDQNICGAYPDATSLYWQGPKGEKGVVLCLKDNK